MWGEKVKERRRWLMTLEIIAWMEQWFHNRRIILWAKLRHLVVLQYQKWEFGETELDPFWKCYIWSSSKALLQMLTTYFVLAPCVTLTSSPQILPIEWNLQKWIHKIFFSTNYNITAFKVIISRALTTHADGSLNKTILSGVSINFPILGIFYNHK